MKVVEIFNSIEGEGFRQGLPVTFIRLGGCNLRCPYCDTKYSWHDDGTWKEMSIEEIIEQVHFPHVTITGGEPLIHEYIEDLIRMLLEKGYEVNIETNGAVDVVKVINSLDDIYANLYFTIDYKCPSSRMEAQMIKGNFIPMTLKERDHFIYKFVVGSQEDLQCAWEVCDCQLYVHCVPQVFISPVYGKIDLKEIVNFMMLPEHREVTQHWRLQTQLHKIIWDPDKRGV